MTEEEWLKMRNPMLLLGSLRGKANDQRFLLCICACLRGLEGIPLDEWYWEGIEKAERQTGEWHTLRDGVQAIKKRLVMNQDFETAAEVRDIEQAIFGSEEGCDRAIQAARRTLLHLPQQYLCRAVHDIFGNPFRPVAVDSSWLTSDVVALAEGIYQERAFDRMPILADALQDAGCNNEDILNHCRKPSEHVRGCWVIDLLTGRK